jgi:DNA-binding SARP family transcriptional activator/tetratricopeptide (TPR) repeat protein
MDVDIRMLGTFSVVTERAPVPAQAWSRRSSASLVKLLALSEGRRLHREQVLDALWPDLPPDVAAPRLHKAAHYARRALGAGPAGVQLRQDVVELLPSARVRVDALDFRRQAAAAVQAGSPELAAAALGVYDGPLLPDDLYEPWTHDEREALTLLHHDLLRVAGRWEELLASDPTDEAAHVALAREHAARGDVHRAQRQLERLDQALRRELGTGPGEAARRLRAELARSGPAAAVTRTPAAPEAQRLVGRRDLGDLVRDRLEQATGTGHGSTLLLTGPAGVGKSAVLDLAVALARRRGWRVARGGASAIEGSWPYAPVLEALSDLCRHHSALLDGLDDAYRRELERARSGEPVPWSGENAHQRLFVAAAELFRLAAAGHGLLLVVDDVHEADEASMRLLHYLARCAVGEPAVLLLAARPDPRPALEEMEQSLTARGIGAVVPVRPLDHDATLRLVTLHHPQLEREIVEEVWHLSDGVPFRALEAARRAESGADDLSVSGLAPQALSVFRRVALLGSAFTTDELLAVSGLDEEASYAALEGGLAAAVVEPAESGYRFRHPLVRETLLAGFPAAERSRAGREVAEQLARLGAPPGRVAHLFVATGRPVPALPYAVPAIETAGAVGAYRDGLDLLDAVVDHASGETRAHLLARRGDLLMALADSRAVDAYRAALPVTRGTEHRLVRARLARAASFRGDHEIAAAALSGLELEGDAADAPILLARGHHAFFTNDVDGAWAAAEAARSRLRPDDPWQIPDLVGLQGLIAHQRGEWFERFRRELRLTRGDPAMATAVFDAHLCVAEYLLYGPVPYDEVIELSDDLRRRAQHHGALRGVAFATSLIGEAALLKGDLDTATCELEDAVALHRDVDAPAGEAHSLQRLAEVRLARGDRAGAVELLHRALPLARWTVNSLHLLQRIYGTMALAAEDPVEAVSVVEQGEAAMGETDRCTFCDVMFAVPAAIVHADVGNLEDAERYLATAEEAVARWEGTAWAAAVAEVRAHLAQARGDVSGAREWMASAADLFRVAGQPLDAQRCAQWVPRETVVAAGLGVR